MTPTLVWLNNPEIQVVVNLERAGLSEIDSGMVGLDKAGRASGVGGPFSPIIRVSEPPLSSFNPVNDLPSYCAELVALIRWMSL